LEEEFEKYQDALSDEKRQREDAQN